MNYENKKPLNPKYIGGFSRPLFLVIRRLKPPIQTQFAISFTLLFFLSITSQAQSYEIRFVSSNPLNNKDLQKIIPPKNLSDSLEVLNFCQTVLQNFQAEGYLLASVDSLVFKEKKVWVYVDLGEKWVWKKLNTQHWQKDLLASFSKRNAKILQKNSLSFAEKKEIEKEILKYWENRGYPFAEICFENWQIEKKQIGADWLIEPNTYIKFDSIIWEGEKNIKSLFWQKYLRFQPNSPFSQNKIDQIQKILNQTPYLKLEKPVTAVFRYERAYPYIRLKKVKINEIDGIIGFLPNSSQTGRFVLTGRANLKLYNLFGTGKYFRLDWQYPKANSQTFRTEYTQANLLNWHLDLNTKFHLLKEDSSFLNVSRGLAFRLDLAEGGKIRFGVQWNESIATDSLLKTNTLESNPIANTEVVLYGLGYEWQNLDNFLYPRKGWEIKIDVGIGNRKTQGNRQISTQNSTQISLQSEISKFWALGKNATFLLKNQSGFLESKTLFINELYRLGGFSMLRGFNENIFYASNYSLTSAEIRLYFQENSAIGAFVDQALVAYDLEGKKYQDNPTGLGFLLNLGTKNGIFNFALALGKSQFQQFGFNQAKVHFGFVNRF